MGLDITSGDLSTKIGYGGYTVWADRLIALDADLAGLAPVFDAAAFDGDDMVLPGDPGDMAARIRKCRPTDPSADPDWFDASVGRSFDGFTDEMLALLDRAHTNSHDVLLF